MSYKADLHMHSVCSDGVLKPEALVEYAFKMGINAVSLTDHDTCDGTAKAMSAAARLGIDFLPGAELSANIPDTDDDIHILAYCMDMSSDESQRYFEAMGEERRERARKTAHRLSGMGIKIDIEKVICEAGSSVGRPHIANELVRCGYVQNTGIAFDLYLKEGRPAYVPREKKDACETVEMIRRCGGVPVLAHPGIIPLSDEKTKSLIAELKEHGLEGLEVYYPAHRRNGFSIWKETALKYGLIMTGGSDFHTFSDCDSDHGNVGCCAEDFENAFEQIEMIRIKSRRGNK